MSAGELLGALGASQGARLPEQGQGGPAPNPRQGPHGTFAILRSGAPLVANTSTILELIQTENWEVLGYGPFERIMFFRPNCPRFLILQDDGKPFLEKDSKAYVAKVMEALTHFLRANCKRATGTLPVLLPSYVRVLIRQPDMELNRICESFYLALPPSRFPGLITALMMGQTFTLPVGRPSSRRSSGSRTTLAINEWLAERPQDELAGETEPVTIYMQAEYSKGGAWVPWTVTDRRELISLWGLIQQALAYWGAQEPQSPTTVGPGQTPEATQRLATCKTAALVLEAWDFRSFKPAQLPLPAVYLLICMGYYTHSVSLWLLCPTPPSADIPLAPYATAAAPGQAHSLALYGTTPPCPHPGAHLSRFAVTLRFLPELLPPLPGSSFPLEGGAPPHL